MACPMTDIYWWREGGGGEGGGGGERTIRGNARGTISVMGSYYGNPDFNAC